MKTKSLLITLLVTLTSIAVNAATAPTAAEDAATTPTTAEDALATPPAAAVLTERGFTGVRLDPNLVPTLQSLKIALSPLAPSTMIYGQGIVTFPIVAGIFDGTNTVAEISHSGGLVFSSGPTKLVVSSFIIEVPYPANGVPVLTGLATLNGALAGRIPLFDIGLSAASISLTHWKLSISGVDLTLNETAATQLNQIFSTTAFNNTIPIGRARVTSFIKRLL